MNNKSYKKTDTKNKSTVHDTIKSLNNEYREICKKMMDILIKGTQNKSYPWSNISDIMDNENLKYTNPELYELISENKFHKIIRNKSFFFKLKSVSVYLLYEFFENHTASTLSFNLYLQTFKEDSQNKYSNKIIKVESTKEECENLFNAILSYVNNANSKISEYLTQFIESEYNSN